MCTLVKSKSHSWMFTKAFVGIKERLLEGRKKVGCYVRKEKGRDLTQTCDKNPFTLRKIQKATWQHKNATKNFDYTTIADRLSTVSLSNSSHPTGVVKPVYERSTFPLTATARNKEATIQTLVQLMHYILKCNRFGMTTVRVFVKIISIPG